MKLSLKILALKLRFAWAWFAKKMLQVHINYLLNRQLCGVIHQAVSLTRIRNFFVGVSVVTICTACQVSASDPATNTQIKGSTTPQVINKTVANPQNSVAASSETAPLPADGEKPAISKRVSTAAALQPLSGTFRMAMMFDKGVKVKPRNEAEGSADSQPDGSQVALLEISSRNGKVEKCVQTSLNGIKASEQPVCTSDGDAIKIVFSDGKAAFNATMEAVVHPDGRGAYKGPLLIRAIIIPDGKRIGEVSLTRP